MHTGTARPGVPSTRSGVVSEEGRAVPRSSSRQCKQDEKPAETMETRQTEQGQEL
jgi:hypothetical protein